MTTEEFVSKSMEALVSTGIRSTKYHYSKMARRPCVLRLSDDKKKLKWEYGGVKKYNLFSKREC